MTEIQIIQATEDDIPSLYRLYNAIGQKDDGYFETCFEKDCIILIAATHNNDNERQELGFVILNFEPKYNLYKKLEIPEIQDLNVVPNYRKQGIGTALIKACENIVTDQGIEQVGISVGLTANYGAAQRLYAQLEYIPDGYGVTYDRASVDHGDQRPVDDDLCLMMIKNLCGFDNDA